MSLKDTMNDMQHLLHSILKDLSKSTNGNKAASQRVRTATIKLEKTAKKYRKESISAEKSGKFKKKAKPSAPKKPKKIVSKKKRR